MITTYTPSRCRYTIDRLKQHVYLISAASCTIHIDNGNAWVDNLTETPLFIKGAVTLNESTSYDDRFKFTKSVSLTVQNYVNLSYLQGKYYVILEDEGGNYWFVNPDFPCLVTYTYTLGDDVSETEFTFNSLSNFPLLRFTGSLTDVRECEQYVINGLKRLRLTEAKNVSYDQSTSTVYLYHDKEFYDVEFLDGTLSITEEFDGNQVNTSIQFAIQLDDYKPSWQYNLLEYQDNRYAAIITTKGADGEFISGFEFGLVPSYSIVGGDNQDGIITITLQGASSYGSLPSGGDSEQSVAMSRWTVVEKEPEYTWKLTEEWVCNPVTSRWVVVSDGYECSGTTKMTQEKEQYSFDSGTTWTDTGNHRAALPVIEEYSLDCGYVPLERWVVVSNEFMCSGTTKMTKEKKELSYDSGTTWVDTIPSESRPALPVIEYNSADCDVIPPVDMTGKLYIAKNADGSNKRTYYCSGNTNTISPESYSTADNLAVTYAYEVGGLGSYLYIGSCVNNIEPYSFRGFDTDPTSVAVYFAAGKDNYTLGRGAFLNTHIRKVEFGDSATTISAGDDVFSGGSGDISEIASRMVSAGSCCFMDGEFGNEITFDHYISLGEDAFKWTYFTTIIFNNGFTIGRNSVDDVFEGRYGTTYTFVLNGSTEDYDNGIAAALRGRGHTVIDNRT